MITSSLQIKLILLLAISFYSTLPLQSAYAEDWTKDPRSATQVAKKKGKIVAPEILDWHKEKKDIPKGWVALKNKYFTVSYPDCFRVIGDGGEDDVKIAEAVILKRQNTCKHFNSELGESNSFSMGILDLAPNEKVENFVVGNELYVQHMKLNNIKAMYFVQAMDGDLGAAIRWHMSMICQKKRMYIIYKYPDGKPSLDRIEKSDYQFPEDFKEIVSTFRCK